MIMGNILDDAQLDAIKKMKNGCILCGDVGSGKSRTALGYFYKRMGGNVDILKKSYEALQKTPKDLYIITTARKRDTFEWDQELCLFLMAGDSGNIYSNKITIDSWNNIKKYTEAKNSFFIFDEQRLIGYGAWVKAFFKIVKNNEWILLTATPGDTWKDYIPVFVANGFYRNKTDFVYQHVVYSRASKFPKIEKYLNTGKLLRYRNELLVNINVSKRTISHHIDVGVEYDHIIYKDMQKRRWNPWTDKPIKNASEYYYCLRKLVNSDESRQLALLDILEDHPRAIVFYNFNFELDILKSLNYKEGTKISEWNGHTHEPILESERWVYFVQYISGAEGWNCISTDTMIFYSEHPSYRINKQASGRIDRRNTPFRDLYYYHLRSSAWIDIEIARAVKEKKRFNISAFMRNDIGG